MKIKCFPVGTLFTICKYCECFNTSYANNVVIYKNKSDSVNKDVIYSQSETVNPIIFTYWTNNLEYLGVVEETVLYNTQLLKKISDVWLDFIRCTMIRIIFKARWN